MHFNVNACQNTCAPSAIVSCLSTSRCVICMIEFNVGDSVRYLPCMHTYHVEVIQYFEDIIADDDDGDGHMDIINDFDFLQCIDDWQMRSFTCPSCMEPVDAALLGEFSI